MKQEKDMRSAEQIVERLRRAFKEDIIVPMNFSPDVPFGEALVDMRYSAAKELYEMCFPQGSASEASGTHE